MAGVKLQVTVPEKTVKLLNKLINEKGLSKSVLIALAIEEYAQKGESNESK